MSAWCDGLANARETVARNGRYARDIRRQIEENGGYTDAEIYAAEHAAKLEELYRRAGLPLPERIRRECEAVREHLRRVDNACGDRAMR